MTDILEPTAAEAERAVLGAMLHNPGAIWEVMAVLRPQDFYEPRHEAIAEAIFRLANESKPTGAIEVNDELERTGRMNSGLEPVFVHTLMAETPFYVDAEYMAEIVRDKAILRRLAQASGRIAQLAEGNEGSALEVVERAREAIDSVAENTKTTLHTAGDSFDAYIDSLAEKPRFIHSPWWDLDSLIGGFRAGCLYLFGGRPGQGKSIVGLNAAMRLAAAGPVAYASLEMGREEIMARMISQVGQVHLTPLMNHTLSPTNWKAVSDTRRVIRDLPLYIDDEVRTLTQVRSFARSVSRRGTSEKPMAGLVVDYVQLMESGKKEESRQVEVASFTRALKLLAKDLDIPVIALSQLNRSMEKGGKVRKPILSDFRESGALEQDADVGILLHHDEDEKTRHEMSMIVAKNRHGLTGDITLQWQGNFSRVLSYEWTPSRLLPREDPAKERQGL